jgi:hypothetical protein
METFDQKVEREWREKLLKAKVIPATPGFFILQYLERLTTTPTKGGDDYTNLEQIDKIPVVAWRILEDENEDAVPVGVEKATNDFTAIMLPDGSVSDMFGKYKNEADWLTSLQEIENDRRNRCRE